MHVDRVGYLVPEFPSQTHAFFWREINTLRALGTTVHPISTRRPPPGACRHAFAGEAAEQTHYGFPPRVAPAFRTLLGKPRRLYSALRYIASLKQTPAKNKIKLLGILLVAADLMHYSQDRQIQHLHVHSCADSAHLAALCRLLGGPTYSLVLHGDLVVYGVDHVAKMREASFIVCVTRPLKEQVEKEVGIGGGRCSVLWMGVDTLAFTEAGRRQPTVGRLNLITVARLNAAKGHLHALAAVRQLLDRGVDVHYVIAGEGPFRAEITAAIEKLSLHDKVLVTGTLSETEVLHRLHVADVLVLPSTGLGEAAPVAVMEGMACGLPIVCSLIGGTGDMIDDGVDGFLVPQGDEAALVDRLHRLALDLPLRDRLGQAARRKATLMFDSRSLGAQLQSLIRNAQTVR